MDKIVVSGGNRLTGRVKVHGAKNAVLPIIAASLLGAKGRTVIADVPALEDVATIRKVIASLGVDITVQQHEVHVDATKIHSYEAPYDLVRKMRASFLVMGPLLARLGQAEIAFPGGCAIGLRPIDQHLKGFEAMGASIELGQQMIKASVNGRLRGAHIYLDVASVGATENLMMAATLADGLTTIENAAKEPEVVDLANYLNAMGAQIRGAGTGVIRIEGVAQLRGTRHTVIPDRVEAGTYMIAAAITGGDLYIEGAIADHLTPVMAKLKEMGVNIQADDNGIRTWVEHKLRSVDVQTLPYPGFPTDLQAQMMALLLTTEGTSKITETVFENRFMHASQFQHMQADVQVSGQTATIYGRPYLAGAKVSASDLRAGAALILAALAAEGVTEISSIQHVDRGYVDIVSNLRDLGANIQRVSLNEMESANTSPIVESEEFGVYSAAQPSWA